MGFFLLPHPCVAAGGNPKYPEAEEALSKAGSGHGLLEDEVGTTAGLAAASTGSPRMHGGPKGCLESPGVLQRGLPQGGG